MTTDATMERLENQIAWYSARSDRNQHLYKWFKITVIVLAALIPLLSGLDIPSIAPMGVPKWFLGVLGALIAVAAPPVERTSRGAFHGQRRLSKPLPP
jgi:hypothetical protein